jgi:hypothetical protein
MRVQLEGYRSGKYEWCVLFQYLGAITILSKDGFNQAPHHEKLLLAII